MVNAEKIIFVENAKNKSTTKINEANHPRGYDSLVEYSSVDFEE